MQMKYKFCGETNYADGAVFTTTMVAPPAPALPVWLDVTSITRWTTHNGLTWVDPYWIGDYMHNGTFQADPPSAFAYPNEQAWIVGFRPLAFRITYSFGGGTLSATINDRNGIAFPRTQIVSGTEYPFSMTADLYSIVMYTNGIGSWAIDKVELQVS